MSFKTVRITPGRSHRAHNAFGRSPEVATSLQPRNVNDLPTDIIPEDDVKSLYQVRKFMSVRSENVFVPARLVLFVHCDMEHIW